MTTRNFFAEECFSTAPMSPIFFVESRSLLGHCNHERESAVNLFINSIFHRQTPFFLILILFFSFATGCGCPSNEDENDDDDDLVVDDDLDDDTDDDADDDTDDDADDDTDDDTDDDADDDTENPTIPVYDENGLYIEMVAGGTPGQNGQDLAITDSGDVYAVAVKGRTLFLYHCDENLEFLGKEILAQFATTPTIGADSAGNLYVLYHDMRQEKLILLTRRDRAWTSETVMDYVYDGSRTFVPMAVQPTTGAVHIAAWDLEDMAMQYVSNSGGEWTFEAVDWVEEFPDTITPKSISIDNENKVHIVYYFDDNYISYFYYATNRSGQWEIDPVVVENRARDIDMAVDEDENPFLVWVNRSDIDTLQFAKKENDVWIVDVFGGENWFASTVEVDYFEGQFHIISADNQEPYNNVQYWTYSNSSLTKISEFATHSSNRRFLKMEVGPGGIIYFTHLYFIDGEFGLSMMENGELQTKVLDTGIDAGYLPSLSVDLDNVPHIAFPESPDLYYHIEKDFFVATRLEDRWDFQNMGYGWSGTVLAGPDGALHVSWWRDQDYKLLYATYSDGEWSEEEEIPYFYDEFHGQRRYNVISIALDSLGSPHLLFTGEALISTYGDVNYSKKEDGVWTTEIIGSSNGYWGAEVNLILDENDKPMASYSEEYWMFMVDFSYLLYFEYEDGQWNSTALHGFPTDERVGEGHDFHYDGQTKYMSYNWYHGYHYLTFARNDGGDWIYEEINDEDTFGTGISTDSNGNVYIAYLVDVHSGGLHTSATRVKVVTKRGDEWIEKTIDFGGEFWSLGIRFEIDSDDQAHVVYRGEYALWYATFPVEYVLSEYVLSE